MTFKTLIANERTPNALYRLRISLGQYDALKFLTLTDHKVTGTRWSIKPKFISKLQLYPHYERVFRRLYVTDTDGNVKTFLRSLERMQDVSSNIDNAALLCLKCFHNLPANNVGDIGAVGGTDDNGKSAACDRRLCRVLARKE